MLSLANKAPHPKAAQLFANWILAKEGLETYARGYGSATLRTDVDESFLNPGNLPKKNVKYFDDTDWKWIVGGRHEISRKGLEVLEGELRRAVPIVPSGSNVSEVKNNLMDLNQFNEERQKHSWLRKSKSITARRVTCRCGR